jgi:hypothetical protein
MYVDPEGLQTRPGQRGWRPPHRPFSNRKGNPQNLVIPSQRENTSGGDTSAAFNRACFNTATWVIRAVNEFDNAIGYSRSAELWQRYMAWGESNRARLPQWMQDGMDFGDSIGWIGITPIGTVRPIGPGIGQVSKVWPRHHPFPMYLGGAVDQTLRKMPRRLHERFHSSLDCWMDGKYSRNKTAKYFEGMSKPEIIDDLRNFYKNGEGGIFSKYLDDFENAVKESGY